MASHAAVLQPSILWDLQKQQEKEKKPQLKPLGGGAGAGKSGWERRAAVPRRWPAGGVQSSPGEGEFPCSPTERKAKGLSGEAVGKGEVPQDTRDPGGSPALTGVARRSFAISALPHSPAVSAAPGRVLPQDAARDSVPLRRLLARALDTAETLAPSG